MNLVEQIDDWIELFVNTPNLFTTDASFCHDGLGVRLSLGYQYLGTPPVGRMSVNVMNILVDPDKRKQGRYAALLRTLIDVCDHRKYNLTVPCVLDLDQHGIYMRRGFVLIPGSYFSFYRTPREEEIDTTTETASS